MNHLIVFLLAIAWCFGLNEGLVCSTGNPRCNNACLLNTLEFRNELTPGNILKVNCTSNRNEDKGHHDVTFGNSFRFFVNENGDNRIVWRCHLRQGPNMEHFLELWRAYRGAYASRCGQLRSWIARVDGVHLLRNDEHKGHQHHWIT
ncbi:unnamed protein product [Microthlaspi erraticum]|uniref:Uncharacterized protein n=1 Tax=Microthlaspi erraticum TaxID=1685480 RepID=A0A6D2IG92_9BRAS|nr:unnamed protein product [Microthlaspi erraticum]